MALLLRLVPLVLTLVAVVSASTTVQYVSGPATSPVTPVGAGLSFSGNTVSSPFFTPGGRSTHCAWIDPLNSSNLVVWAGLGVDPSGVSGPQASLWSCSLSDTGCSWRHVGGSPSANSGAVPARVPVSAYQFSFFTWPGARYGACALPVTKGPRAGTVYVFGGFGMPSDGGTQIGYLADMWAFRSDSGFALLGGNTASNGVLVLGTQGVESALVVPGGQLYMSQMFGDANPFIYVFGGPSTDLVWRFNCETRLWTWMAGAAGRSAGFNSAPFAFSLLNSPGARYGGTVVTLEGTTPLRHVLVGGSGVAVAGGAFGSPCSIWEYSDAGGGWMMTGGQDVVGCAPGTSGFEMGARSELAAWSLGGRIFYGFGTGTFGVQGDVFEYAATTRRFAYVTGSQVAGFVGSFGTVVGAESTLFVAPARVGSRVMAGRLAPDGVPELFLVMGGSFASVFKIRLGDPFVPTTTVLTSSSSGSSTSSPVDWCSDYYSGLVVGSSCLVTAPLQESAPCVRTFFPSHLTVPTATSPVLRFSGPAAKRLACSLEISFSFSPVAGTYVVGLIEPGANVMGLFPSVKVAFSSLVRASSTGCTSTSAPTLDPASGAITVAVEEVDCGGLPIWVFIAAGVGGAVLLAVLVIVVVLLVRRHNSRQGYIGQSEYSTPYESAHDLEPLHKYPGGAAESTIEFEVPEQGTVLKFH